MTVNGTVLTSPAFNVNLSKDTVAVDGVSINSQTGSRGPRTPSMFVVHKLPGELVTRHDPAGRPTVFSRVEAMGLPKNLIAVVSCGVVCARVGSEVASVWRCVVLRAEAVAVGVRVVIDCARTAHA